MSNIPDSSLLGIAYDDITLDIESYGKHYTRKFIDLVPYPADSGDFALAESLELEGLFEGKIKTPYPITCVDGYNYVIKKIYDGSKTCE